MSRWHTNEQLVNLMSREVKGQKGQEEMPQSWLAERGTASFPTIPCILRNGDEAVSASLNWGVIVTHQQVPGLSRWMRPLRQ
jgi:hypothetical protein